MKNEISNIKPLSFPTKCDTRSIEIAIVKFSTLLITLALPEILVQDFILLLSVILITGLWFIADFYSQPYKIVLYHDRLVLRMLTGSVNLFYDNIKQVQQPTPQHFKLLKRKNPGFQFWGTRGWYSSKFLDNIFIYSLSSDIVNQILIKYGVDYYLLSVEHSEELSRQIEMRCGFKN